MRIKNLYIGCIWRIDKINYENDPYVTDPLTYNEISKSILENVSILYRFLDKSKYAIDVINGGVYHIGLPKNTKINQLHVGDLDKIGLCGLYAEGYSCNKNNIDRKELLTYFPKLKERYIKNLIKRGGNL